MAGTIARACAQGMAGGFEVSSARHVGGGGGGGGGEGGQGRGTFRTPKKLGTIVSQLPKLRWAFGTYLVTTSDPEASAYSRLAAAGTWLSAF